MPYITSSRQDDSHKIDQPSRAKCEGIQTRVVVTRQGKYFHEADFDNVEMEQKILSPMPVSCSTSCRQAPREIPAYFAHLYTVPLLTREQEFHCFRKLNFLKHLQACEQNEFGNSRSRELNSVIDLADEIVSVRNFIVESNLRLVVAIARRVVQSTTIEFDELVSVGNETLVRSVDLFDYRRGYRFNTYVFRAVERSLRALIRGSASSKIIDDAEDQEAMNHVSCDVGESILSQRKAEAAKRVIKPLLSELSDRDRSIILSRFGFGHEDNGASFRVISKQIGVSAQRTAQLYHRSIKQMRTSIERKCSTVRFSRNEVRAPEIAARERECNITVNAIDEMELFSTPPASVA